MNEFSRKGIVTSAGMAEPLKGVTVHCIGDRGKTRHRTGGDGQWCLPADMTAGEIRFELEGYVSRRFDLADLPRQVRMLENRLIGYQDRLWYRPGEEVSAYIHAPGPYDARLIRYGLERKTLHSVRNAPACTQEVPDGSFVADGLAWDVSLTYSIPDSAKPGLYSLLLNDGDQVTFAIPFVVSTPAGTEQPADLLVVASTNNWTTYNIWGGRNRYRNFEDGVSEPYLWDPGYMTGLLAAAGRIAPRPLVRRIRQVLGLPRNDPEWKFKKLNIHRPFTNCGLEEEDVYRPFTNHLAAGEWRVLAWLEREGFRYDIISGYELHHSPEILQKYRCVVLSTHSEYWSAAMYEGLDDAHRNHRLSLLNLSGNSLYREVDFYRDGSLRCTSLKFGESVEDETQLIGVRFTEGDFGTCAPFRVMEPDHWSIHGLAGKNDIFGTSSLNRQLPNTSYRYDPAKPGIRSGLQGDGASGWETDKLSRTAPRDFLRVAKGCNRGGGADMVIREPEGTRGGVFSASSITFGGSLLIDRTCSEIVNRVIKRFTGLSQSD